MDRVIDGQKIEGSVVRSEVTMANQIAFSFLSGTVLKHLVLVLNQLSDELIFAIKEHLPILQG